MIICTTNISYEWLANTHLSTFLIAYLQHYLTCLRTVVTCLKCYKLISAFIYSEKPLVVGEAKGFQYGSDQPQHLQQSKGSEHHRTDKKT